MPIDFDLSEMDLNIRDLEAPIIQANRMAFNKLRILDKSGTLTTVAISENKLAFDKLQDLQITYNDDEKKMLPPPFLNKNLLG